MSLQLEFIVWKEGNHYVAQCLNIDISSFGDSKKEALGNLQEAVELYFEDGSSTDITIVENPELVHSTIDNA
ncbi:MAG: type II toxin-antitoxin system HicB family antitoxin [Bacteroidetes bacterium]|nr:type II toxin-antitoxin system HicB family antitoxin [Bacteroidota bacterium]